MAFTINMSGTAEVDDSIREEYDVEFRVAFAEQRFNVTTCQHLKEILVLKQFIYLSMNN